MFFKKKFDGLTVIFVDTYDYMQASLIIRVVRFDGESFVIKVLVFGDALSVLVKLNHADFVVVFNELYEDVAVMVGIDAIQISDIAFIF